MTANLEAWLTLCNGDTEAEAWCREHVDELRAVGSAFGDDPPKRSDAMAHAVLFGIRGEERFTGIKYHQEWYRRHQEKL
jgi:hypothetical protein